VRLVSNFCNRAIKNESFKPAWRTRKKHVGAVPVDRPVAKDGPGIVRCNKIRPEQESTSTASKTSLSSTSF
jgi:hypothetical protein